MSYNETVMAAARALVEAAGGVVPAGATYNELVRLAAATIITGGGAGSVTDEAIASILDDPDSDAIGVLNATIAAALDGASGAPVLGLSTAAAKLDMKSQAIISFSICGDSTSDSKASSTDNGGVKRDRSYALMLRQSLAALWPERKVQYYERWAGGAATDGRSDPPYVWQAGDTVGGTPLDVFRDTFNRTGPLVGSAPTVGVGNYGGTANQLETDGAKLKPVSSGFTAYAGQATCVTHTGSNFNLSAKLTLANPIPTGKSVQLGVYVDNNNRLSMALAPTAIGGLQVIARTTAGSRTVISFSNSALPSDSATVPFPVALSLDGLNVSATIGTTTLTGTLTSAELTAIGGWTKYNMYVDEPGFTMDDLAITVPTVAVPAFPEVHVYNQSVPGSRADHFVTRGQLAIAYPERPDVLFINHGHNYGTDSPATFLAAIDAFYEAFSAIWPDVPVVVLSQNPQFPTQPSAQILAQTARMVALKAHAAARGWEYIATYEEMAKQSDGGANLVIYNGADQGLHPNVAGSQKQADAGVRFIKAHSARTPV